MVAWACAYTLPELRLCALQTAFLFLIHVLLPAAILHMALALHSSEAWTLARLLGAPWTCVVPPM